MRSNQYAIVQVYTHGMIGKCIAVIRVPDPDQKDPLLLGPPPYPPDPLTASLFVPRILLFYAVAFKIYFLLKGTVPMFTYKVSNKAQKKILLAS